MNHLGCKLSLIVLFWINRNITLNQDMPATDWSISGKIYLIYRTPEQAIRLNAVPQNKLWRPFTVLQNKYRTPEQVKLAISMVI